MAILVMEHHLNVIRIGIKMPTIIFEVANDIGDADIELMINDIIERHKPLLKSGRLEV